MKEVDIYTDGACSGNPGAGAYAAVMLYKQKSKKLVGGYKVTTNNRMELMGVIKGLSELKQPCRVNLYTDSRYVVDAVTKGWVYRWREKGWMRTKTEKALNSDLWELLLPLLDKNEVTFIWVKGHANNPGNEECDSLARDYIKNGVLLDDKNYK